MPIKDLDDFDRKIIAELQADGTMSNVELANRIGLSESPCLRRVKKLEDDGYIVGYRAILDRNQIGLRFSVFVSVKLNGNANDPAKTFERAVLPMPEILACHVTTGDADYLLEIVTHDLEHYRKFLLGKLLELAVIREVRSDVVLETVKAAAPLPLDHLVDQE